MALIAALLALIGLCPAGASAFSFISAPGSTAPLAAANAARWAVPGGGPVEIRVAVEAELVDRLLPSASSEERVRLEQAVLDAFRAWETPALRFSVTLDAFAEGATSADPLRVLAVPSDVFPEPGFGFAGVAVPQIVIDPDRTLTNGTVLPGQRIDQAEIILDLGNFGAFDDALDFGVVATAAALQRFFMHEIGHAIGLAHANALEGEINYDTDFDPFNEIVIDPANPFAELIVSPERNEQAILSSRPCGPDVTTQCVALIFTTLSADDVGGRDVLYPALVSEPAGVALAAHGLLWLGRRRRR